MSDTTREEAAKVLDQLSIMEMAYMTVDRSLACVAGAAALRSPSPGAAEMREAAAKVAEGGRFLHDDSPEARWGKACAAAIRALSLPAPEVPEAIKRWVAWYESRQMRQASPDNAMRDWIRKEYGI